MLLTGDTGFKGSWLSIWLRELGAEVYGFALPPKTSLDNYVVCRLDDLIHHTDGDIRDIESLTEFFAAVQPEFAFHLAAQSLVLPSYKAPVDTFATNVMGTVHFLEAVRHTPSVRVALNITSDKCYQNNESGQRYAETDPMGGNDPYSASKGCSELVTHAYRHSFFSEGKCRLASARAGNVIGGGDWAEHRIIPDLFRAHFSGKDLVVRNPEATRPWQFVLEPVFGYLKLAQKLHESGASFEGGWNFGPMPGNHHTVTEVIGEVTRNIPALKWRKDDAAVKPHEAQLLNLDIAKAMQRLGWRPLLTFEETIAFTVDGYMSAAKGGDVYGQRAAQIKKFISKF